MPEFRVIDLQTETIDPELRIVAAPSPEKAAEIVLGLKLVRSGAKRELKARVYWTDGGTTNMVRLYGLIDAPD